MFPKPLGLAVVLTFLAVVPAQAEIIKGVMGIKGAEMN
jgi:hypothetical protein